MWLCVLCFFEKIVWFYILWEDLCVIKRGWSLYGYVLLMVIICFDNYVCVFFKYYVVVVVEIEYWDGGEFGWRVVGLRNYGWVY